MKLVPATQAEVVVIGAGMGGLTAAALLARAGRDVVVVEAQPRPGGYLAGFQRGGFHFDSAIHWLNQCGPGGFVHKIGSWLGEDFPVAPPLHRIRRYKSDTFDYLLTDQPDDLRDQLIADMPGDASGITRLFRDSEVIGERMARYSHLNRSTATMGWLAKARYGWSMAVWGLPFARIYSKTAVDGLARYAPSGRLAQIFRSEDTLLSVLVPLGWAYRGDYQSPPPGGSQAYARWLVDRVRGLGGTVMLGQPVERVLLDGDRVAGVRLRSGQPIKSRYVLSAMDVETTYRELLPPGVIPQNTLDMLAAGDLYDSAVTVSLGLDCPAQDLGFDEAVTYFSADGVGRDVLNRGDPSTAGIQVLAPSVRDSSLVPPGKGSLTLYCGASLNYGDRWKTGDGLARTAEYKAFKNAYAQTMLDRVESALAPDLRQHIELIDVATPVTHWRYTGNKDGSIMGARPTKANIKAGLAHYRTPVKNLLLAGQWAEYGGGVPIAVKAGTNAALLVLRREDPAAFKALVRVTDHPFP